MMTKEEYEKEIVRMWDSVRESHKGEHTCGGVVCDNRCPLYVKDELGNIICWSPEDCFKVIEAVEKWAKENPPKKYKVSQLEYDILKSYLDYKYHMTVDIADYFFEDGLLLSLLKKGHFKGATKEMLIKDYLNDCEVA